MSADRAANSVTLPLVWRADYLWVGKFWSVGEVSSFKRKVWSAHHCLTKHDYYVSVGDFTSRAAAKAAVERVVREQLAQTDESPVPKVEETP